MAVKEILSKTLNIPSYSKYWIIENCETEDFVTLWGISEVSFEDFEKVTEEWFESEKEEVETRGVVLENDKVAIYWKITKHKNG